MNGFLVTKKKNGFPAICDVYYPVNVQLQNINDFGAFFKLDCSVLCFDIFLLMSTYLSLP
jgi:hypothetical protein